MTSNPRTAYSKKPSVGQAQLTPKPSSTLPANAKPKPSATVAQSCNAASPTPSKTMRYMEYGAASQSLNGLN